MVKVHFIDNSDDKIITKRYVSVVPTVGDELRFSSGVFHKVTLIVFVYDEYEERVNIGCELIRDVQGDAK